MDKDYIENEGKKVDTKTGEIIIKQNGKTYIDKIVKVAGHPISNFIMEEL